MADHIVAKDTTPRPHQGGAIPQRDGDDFATLAAWYSGFAFCEHYRKVVLAQCREATRGAVALAGQKFTEAKLDDMAHTHPNYLDYLAHHLQGRVKWEREYLAQGGMR